MSTRMLFLSLAMVATASIENSGVLDGLSVPSQSGAVNGSLISNYWPIIKSY